MTSISKCPRSKLSLRLFASTAVIALLLIGVTPAMASLSCKPYIVFYGGFGNTMKKNLLHRICVNYSKKGVRKRCLSWKEGEIDHIVNYWKPKQSGTYTPVVLVGFSFGGDTAYSVAKKLPRHYWPTLITLDAVGSRSYRSSYSILWGYIFESRTRINTLKKPTKGAWINVYRKVEEGFGALNPFNCNSLAGYGGPYGHQNYATVSKSFKGDHCDVGIMFKIAERYIDWATRCLND